MVDLSNNNTPLKDLPKDAQIAILEAYLAQTLIRLCRGYEYKALSLRPQEIYRIPAQPPVYPWEHIADYIEWIAIDEDGAIWGFVEDVDQGQTCWISDGNSYLLHIKIERGTVPWTETLQRRPKAGDKS